MGSTVSAEVLELIDNRLEYQGAVSGRRFSNSSTEEELSCMNCRWMEMGHMSSFSGRCDWCGGVPPSLQWMYPGSSSRGQARIGSSRPRRRPPRQGETRSSSTERAHGRTTAATVTVGRRHQRRLSADNGVSVGGLSAAKIEKLSFKQTYSKVVDLESKEATQCVICITDFQPGVVVRRLACMHLFHTACVDAWLTHNRCCPVCRLDVEQAALGKS